MSLRTFAPSSDERVIAGVCAGIAQTLAVDPTLVRLVFALLALAGGAGILLYLALWAWAEGKRAWVGAILAFVAGLVLLGAIGLSTRAVVGIALIAGGLALAWRQGGSFHPEAPLSYGGIGLAALGAVVLLSGGGTSSALLAPGADHHVVGGGGADRHARVRQVGQHLEDLGPLPLDPVQLDFELLDPLAALLVGLEDVRCVLAAPLGPRHFVAGRVLLALEPFDLRNQTAAVGFDRGELLELR